MLVEMITAGIIVAILILLVGFLWIRHDNAINHREEIRSQRALATSGQRAPSYMGNDDSSGFDFQSLIRIAMENPELVKSFLGGEKKE